MWSLRSQDDADLPRAARLPWAHVAAVLRESRRQYADAGADCRGRVGWGGWRLAWRAVRRPGVLVALAAGAIVTMTVVWLVRDTAVGLGMLMFSPIWVPIFGAVLFGVRGLLAARDGLAGEVRACMLAESRCPACGYALSVMATEARLCRCPECGLAWSSRDVGRPVAQQMQEVIVRSEPP